MIAMGLSSLTPREATTATSQSIPGVATIILQNYPPLFICNNSGIHGPFKDSSTRC